MNTTGTDFSSWSQVMHKLLSMQ